ncbi:MAG: tRNA (adenosine(37)-N6)-dimethylallyltransferase MiaA [Desulfovibrio sp.]|nr:tRNA (adenosine(37)-N6)-dimethylallyltransferase MiaA [Desulfovibrio sp.]
MSAEPLPVLCLAGPTGAGKTELALRLARLFDCEIINADSRQVYADFPIVTAQPDSCQRAQAPHHLYGFLPASAKFSAGEWLRRALPVCRAITARRRLPLLVGGTGFYFNSLLHGFAEIPPVPAEISLALQEQAASKGLAHLHERLCRLDPAYAAKIHPHDRQRILRSLEVCLATGKAFSWWHEHQHRKPQAKGPLLVIAVSLAGLAPLLERRIDAMLAKGAIEEARLALASCADGSAPGWSGIGCAELHAYLQGRISLEECRRLWLANTRAYAKRQLTWFRGRKDAIWITPDDPEAILAILKQSGYRPAA